MDKIELSTKDLLKIIGVVAASKANYPMYSNDYLQLTKLMKKFRELDEHYPANQTYVLMPAHAVQAKPSMLSTHNCPCGESNPVVGRSGKCTKCGMRFEILEGRNSNG